MPVYSVTAGPFSVNVGFAAVAVRLGSSFTAVTVTVDAMLRAAVSSPPPAVPPLSWIDVSVTVRLDPNGASLVFRYFRPSTNVWASVTAMPPVLLSVTVAVPPVTATL